MSGIIRFYKSASLCFLVLSLFSLNCSADTMEIFKRGPECLDGFQTTFSDVNGSYYYNPLSQITFCYTDSYGAFSTMFGNPYTWIKETTQKMNKTAALDCRSQGALAFVVEMESHASPANVFMTNSYICMKKSELDLALAQGFFKSGIPEIVDTQKLIR